MRKFHVIGATTLAAKQAVKQVGVDGVLVQAYWDQLQPNGPDSTLNSAALAALNQQILDARGLGLIVSFEYAPHYPPAWAKAAIEPFTDQEGATYASADSGKDVRNWIWTALGRQYIEDFYTKVYQGLTPDNRNSIVFIKFGGGYYGEIQYPVEFRSMPFSYWGYGSSMQSGIGLFPGLDACPVPGYVVFSGNDENDILWINWYLKGIENFVQWQINLLKSLGFTCPLYALHSGYSTRQNQNRSDSGWRQNFACGQDFTRMLGIYKNDPQVWPWTTWIGGADGWTPNTYDSDQASWKKLYSTAAARGKHYLIGGENTGGETGVQLGQIIDQVFNDITPSTGPIYADGRPRTGWLGFQHMMWLDYASLMAGDSRADLADLASIIEQQR